MSRHTTRNAIYGGLIFGLLILAYIVVGDILSGNSPRLVTNDTPNAEATAIRVAVNATADALAATVVAQVVGTPEPLANPAVATLVAEALRGDTTPTPP
jgi:hypothetical protein